MKIDVSNTQDMPALSGSVKKASNTITKAEAGRIGKQVRAALKDAGIPTAMFSVSPGEKGAVVRSAFHPKTMSADFQNEKNYSRSFKAALKDAGLKVGGVKPVGGPGSKFMMEVKASASASLEDGLESESASKKQQENAKILFGSKGVSILSKLEDYSKEKQLNTKGIDYLIGALKTKDTAALEKYAASAAGKKMVANVKKLASAKTFSAIMANIKSIKPNAALQKLSGATITPNMRTQKPGSAPVKVGAVAGLVAKKLSPKYQKVLEASIGKGLTFNQESVKETLRAIVIADKTNSKISDVYEYLDGDDTVSLTDSQGNDASPADVKPLRAMLTNGSRTSVEKGLTKLMTDTGLTQKRAKSILFDLENYDPYAQVVAALLLNDSSPSLIKVFDKGLVNSVKKLLVTLREEGIINSPKKPLATSLLRGSTSEGGTVRLKSSVVKMSNLLTGKYLQLFGATVNNGFLLNGEDQEESTLAILVANMTKAKVSDYFEFMDGDDSVKVYTEAGDPVADAGKFKKFSRDFENGSRDKIEKGLIRIFRKDGLAINEAEVMLEELLDHPYPKSSILAALIASGANVSSMGFSASEINAVKKIRAQF